MPRVTRTARRLGLRARRPNGRYAFTATQARRLADALGSTPRLEGFSRSEAMALGALRSAPFGLVSARAVARRGGLSPTAAGRALESLRKRGLVDCSEEMVAAGKAREMEIWHANLQHPSWSGLDPVLDRVRPPAGAPAAGADRRVPRRLSHLFWNTAESQLDVHRAGPYIATRLLRTMDLQGLAWGAKALAAEDWCRAARARGLDPKVRRLALNLGAFAVTHESAGTLKGVFEKTRIEVFDASGLNLLGEPAVIAGLRVAGLHDLMAMKLKVLAERGEMRDYFDVKAIDEHGAVSVEEGVGLYMRRYGVAPSDEVLLHLYRAMGDLSDVEADDLVPADLEDLRRWWSARQARILRNSDRFG